MRKRALGIMALVLTFSMTASAWDVLAHSFIMEQIKGGPGKAGGNEIYGITSPDFVNYLLNTPYYEYLYGQTHKNFMKLWNQAETPGEQSLAMGFVAHNGLWGADHVAHVSSLTLADKSTGYVIAKAMALEQLFWQFNVWAALGLTEDADEPFRLEICHNIIEYTIDIQVWASDPTIAGRVVQAAIARDGSMQHLVKTAFVGGLVAYSQKTDNRAMDRLNQPGALLTLQTAELGFQERVAYYGGLFASATDLSEVVENLGVYVSLLAKQMFDLTIEPGDVETLFYIVLQSGLVSDVAGELMATVSYVRDQLAAHNIVYGSQSLIKAAPMALTKNPTIR